jgi:hypothetical protein
MIKTPFKFIQKTYLRLGKIYEGYYTNQSHIDYFVKEINKNISSKMDNKTNVKAQMTDFQHFTNDENFNLFISSIHKVIYEGWGNDLENFKVKDAWGVKINDKDHEVKPHTHASINNVVSGILYLSNKGPGTHFPELDITVKEEAGKYVLFNSCLIHEVKKYNQEIERYTMAFNLDEIKPWDNEHK